MKKTTFGERLRLAFNNANNAEIARKIGVSSSGVVNYLNGRIPDIEKLEKIKALTNCDLDWLLTGDESRIVKGLTLSPQFAERLTFFAEEQSHVVFGDIEIGGSNLTDRTLTLLTQYLIARAMRSVNLIDNETELMSEAEFKLASRFTFVANLPQSLDDRIAEIVDKRVTGKDVSQVAQGGEIRDMIRDIVQEEISRSRAVPVFPLRAADAEDDEQQTPRRKAG